MFLRLRLFFILFPECIHFLGCGVPFYLTNSALSFRKFGFIIFWKTIFFHSICFPFSQLPMHARDLSPPFSDIIQCLTWIPVSLSTLCGVMMFNLFKSLEDYEFRLFLFGYFIFWHVSFTTLCFYLFLLILMHRSFLLISHCWTRTVEAWWAGKGQKSDVGTHFIWSFLVHIPKDMQICLSVITILPK